MKILLAGSPQISVKAFEEVIKNFNVVGILTQPDKPKGRGMELQETAVSTLASKYKIKTFKPSKISEIKDELLGLEFDLLLTFAFGQWIPSFLLNKGKYKPVNIHGSLLPKYRGAAPIHYAILNGDKEIGITLMEMIKEMDAGDMFFKDSVSIDDKTTTGDAFELIQNLAASNIVKWLKEIEQGNINPIPQGNNFTLSPKIEKSYGELKSDMSVKETIRRIKGLSPFPGAFKIIEGKRLKVFDVITDQKNNSIEIKCKDGSVFAVDYQRESKKRIRI